MVSIESTGSWLTTSICIKAVFIFCVVALFLFVCSFVCRSLLLPLVRCVLVVVVKRAGHMGALEGRVDGQLVDFERLDRRQGDERLALQQLFLHSLMQRAGRGREQEWLGIRRWHVVGRPLDYRRQDLVRDELWRGQLAARNYRIGAGRAGAAVAVMRIT